MAAAEPGRATARLICELPHGLNKLLQVLTKVGTADQLHIVDEAGLCEFRLQQALEVEMLATGTQPTGVAAGHARLFQACSALARHCRSAKAQVSRDASGPCASL